MARGHGRILTSVWEDDDFLDLTQEQQRLYLFLISQPNLNHAGLLPLTLRRWARKAAGLTSGELDKHLAALHADRFIVVDDDTEELLIRSFVRNDGVWKQPKVMGAMVSGAMEISSRHLRRALLEEMDRVPLAELSDDPTKLRTGEGPSIRAQVSAHIETLRKAFLDPDPTPSRQATAGGCATPWATPSASPSESPADGHREGSTRGHAGAQTRAAPALSPSPVPYPSPVEDVVASVVELRLVSDPTEPAQPAAGKPAPRRSTPAPDAITVTDAMRTWAVTRNVAADRIDRETERFLDYHRAKGNAYKDWIAAWRNWMSRAADFAPRQATGTGGYQGPHQALSDSDYAEQGDF